MRSRWLVGALLVAVGWLASPAAVPVYDGIGVPDEPYRYVDAPDGAAKTAPATGVTAQTTVRGGRNAEGLSVQTAEQGPQFSLFLPQFSMAAPGGVIAIAVAPEVPSDSPPGATADGNVYRVSLTDPAGPVTLTDKAAIATLYLRATSQRKPQPTMYFRAEAGQPWRALATSAGGFDVRVASFVGPGQYVAAFDQTAGGGGKSGGAPVVPLVLVGILVVLVGVVLVVRLRGEGGQARELSATSSA